MVAIGMGVAWFGYAVGLYGYCLTKQYDVKFLDLVAPTGSMSWPPPLTADAVNNQTPQPTVAEQYLAPLLVLADAVASFVGGAAGAVGSAAGAVGGGVSTGLDRLGNLLTGKPVDGNPPFAAGEVPGGFGVLGPGGSGGGSSSTPTPSSVTGGGVVPWTITNPGGR